MSMLEFVTPDGKLVTLRGLAIQPRPSSLRARIADGTLMPYPEGFVKGTVKGVAEILLKQERLSLAYRHRTVAGQKSACLAALLENLYLSDASNTGTHAQSSSRSSVNGLSRSRRIQVPYWSPLNSYDALHTAATAEIDFLYHDLAAKFGEKFEWGSFVIHSSGEDGDRLADFTVWELAALLERCWDVLMEERLVGAFQFAVETDYIPKQRRQTDATAAALAADGVMASKTAADAPTGEEEARRIPSVLETVMKLRQPSEESLASQPDAPLKQRQTISEPTEGIGRTEEAAGKEQGEAGPGKTTTAPPPPPPPPPARRPPSPPRPTPPPALVSPIALRAPSDGPESPTSPPPGPATNPTVPCQRYLRAGPGSTDLATRERVAGPPMRLASPDESAEITASYQRVDLARFFSAPVTPVRRRGSWRARIQGMFSRRGGGDL